jgi:hypothetical protein
MDGKIYVTITAGKSTGLPAIDEYVFEYTPKFKEGGFVLIKVNDNFSHPDTGANLNNWVELYYRTSLKYVNQKSLILYSIDWAGNQVFGEKAITPHKTICNTLEYYIERHNTYQYESKMQPLYEYIDNIVTQVNGLPSPSKLHLDLFDKDNGKFFYLFVGNINETDDEIIRTGDCTSIHFSYNDFGFCGNEVIKNDNGFFNLNKFVSENDTVGGDDNVEYHFDSFDILFKDNINFKELKFVIRYYSQNNYHSFPLMSRLSVALLRTSMTVILRLMSWRKFVTLFVSQLERLIALKMHMSIITIIILNAMHMVIVNT